MKKIICAALLLAFALMFAGCNTIKGVGEDIQWTGEKIKESAD